MLAQLLFSPKGSIQRLQFLGGMLASTFGLLIIFYLFWAIQTVVLIEGDIIVPQDLTSPFPILHVQGFKGLDYNTTYELLVVLSWIGVILAILWSHLCLMLKRLRDLMLSPWLIIIYYLLYIPTWLVTNPLVFLSLWTATGIIWLLFLLWPSRQR